MSQAGYDDQEQVTNRKTLSTFKEQMRDSYPFLRACLKRSGSSESPHHQTSHRNVNHSLAALTEPFIVQAQASTLREPGKSAFHHPAPWEQDKAFLPLAAQDGLQNKGAV